jgi:hypothetical protein
MAGPIRAYLGLLANVQEVWPADCAISSCPERKGFVETAPAQHPSHPPAPKARRLRPRRQIQGGKKVQEKKHQETSRNVKKPQETSRNIKKHPETSRNLKKAQEMSRNVKKRQETSRNIKKRQEM